jgi:transposase InsO family protein
MTIHPIPSLPWIKVGIDLFEDNGHHYLVMVDYYSNFIEVTPPLPDTRTSTVVRHLRRNIARYGIMHTLVSDNGPQFSSAEFEDFTVAYNITHLTSSPLHSQSNGLAEKAVQTVQELMIKCRETGGDIYLSLLDLRNTPRDSEIGSSKGVASQKRWPLKRGTFQCICDSAAGKKWPLKRGGLS